MAAAFPYHTEWEGVRFDYFACGSCGAVFVHPLPTPEQLRATYSWEAYHRRNYTVVDQARYRSSAGLLAEFVGSGRRLLDFGCGTGGFLRAASEIGFVCHGVELNQDVAVRAAAAAGVPVTQLDEVVVSGQRFDVVVLRDVLAHLDDPVGMLSTLEKILSPRGVFFFDSPLEEERSLVRSVAQWSKRVRRALGVDRRSSFPPTMLFRASAAVQRRFLIERMGYTEQLFRVYETGWPYRIPSRVSSRPDLAVKQAIGTLAVGIAAMTRPLGIRMGNRFFGIYRAAP